jgi:hypothetical protein
MTGDLVVLNQDYSHGNRKKGLKCIVIREYQMNAAWHTQVKEVVSGEIFNGFSFRFTKVIPEPLQMPQVVIKTCINCAYSRYLISAEPCVTCCKVYAEGEPKTEWKPGPALTPPHLAIPSYTFSGTIDLPRLFKENSEDGNLAFLVVTPQHISICIHQNICEAFPTKEIPNSWHTKLSEMCQTAYVTTGGQIWGNSGNSCAPYRVWGISRLVTMPFEFLTSLMKEYKEFIKSKTTVHTFK